MLIATLLLILSTHSVRYAREYIDLSRGKPPLDKIKDVSAFVSSNSNPSDRILVIEGLWVAVDSGRPVLPGLTLSSFSYQSDMSTERAKELKFVNYDILLEYITHGDAKVVVFTKRDWKTFNQSGKAELLNNALLSKYKLALVVDNFGQRAEEVYVYLRRENQTNIS
jgi:hypothetical protein